MKKIESLNKELEKENKKLKYELKKVSSSKNEQNGNVSPHGNPINPSRFSSIFEAANYVSQKEAIWKSPVCVTPEAQVPLTLESKFRMTPIKS